MKGTHTTDILHGLGVFNLTVVRSVHTGCFRASHDGVYNLIVSVLLVRNTSHVKQLDTFFVKGERCGACAHVRSEGAGFKS